MNHAKKKAIVKIFRARDLIELAATKICSKYGLNAQGNLHFMFGPDPKGGTQLRVDITDAIEDPEALV